MRKTALPAILSLLLLTLVLAAAQVPATAQTPEAAAAWETYTFPGEEFSVALPEMPSLDHSDRQLKGERDKFDSARTYGAYGNGVVYLMRAYDRPRRNEDLDFFANYYMRSSVYTGQSFGIESTRELRGGKFPGRQYAVKRDNTPDGIPASSLYVYLAGRHAYALRVIGADDEHPETKRFLSSFNLTERPAGREIIDEWKLPRPPVVLSNTTTLPGDRPASAPGGQQPAAGDAQTAGGGEGGGKIEGGEPRERIYRVREATRKAALVSRPEPIYTEEARRNQVTGTVRLRLVASASGKITNIVALALLPDGLTENAVLAARHIKFIPAVKDGRRVSQYVLIEYNFNIY